MKQSTSSWSFRTSNTIFSLFFQIIIARSEYDKQRKDTNRSERERDARPPRDPGGIRNLGVGGEDDNPSERRAQTQDVGLAPAVEEELRELQGTADEDPTGIEQSDRRARGAGDDGEWSEESRQARTRGVEEGTVFCAGGPDVGEVGRENEE